MSEPVPSRELYTQVRAGFVLQNDTLTAWCKRNGMHISNARTCLTGSWDGPSARALRARICDAARIAGVRVAA